jgi:NADH:ubiquinone oxidoreductase subunit 6 (subunit J)
VKDDVKFVLVVGLFITLAFSVMPGLQVLPRFQGQATGAEDATAIAQFLFGPFALPLIILSTALLVALVAALVLAKPDPEDL